MSIGFCERDGPSSAGGGAAGALATGSGAGAGDALAAGAGAVTAGAALGAGGGLATGGSAGVDGGGGGPQAAAAAPNAKLQTSKPTARCSILNAIRREHTPSAEPNARNLVPRSKPRMPSRHAGESSLWRRHLATAPPCR